MQQIERGLALFAAKSAPASVKFYDSLGFYLQQLDSIVPLCAAQSSINPFYISERDAIDEMGHAALCTNININTHQCEKVLSRRSLFISLARNKLGGSEQVFLGN